jgi:hypothetical protein
LRDIDILKSIWNQQRVSFVRQTRAALSNRDFVNLCARLESGAAAPASSGGVGLG